MILFFFCMFFFVDLRISEQLVFFNRSVHCIYLRYPTWPNYVYFLFLLIRKTFCCASMQFEIHTVRRVAPLRSMEDL